MPSAWHWQSVIKVLSNTVRLPEQPSSTWLLNQWPVASGHPPPWLWLRPRGRVPRTKIKGYRLLDLGSQEQRMIFQVRNNTLSLKYIDSTLNFFFCKWWCFVLTEFSVFCSFRIQKWRKKEVMQYKDRHSWNVWFCWSILENQVSSYLTTAHIYSRNTGEARKWILS